MGSTGMWRMSEMLPAVTPVSVGEGATPMLRSRQHAGLWIKDESQNPGGSVWARGMSVAVSAARQQGIMRVGYGGPGKGCAALARYGAAAGVSVQVVLPEDASFESRVEVMAFGAEVVGEIAEDWLDLSDPEHPWRAAGTATVAAEILEQLGGVCPEVVLVPAGFGLVAMEAGYAQGGRPRMVEVVPAEICTDGEALAEVLEFARAEGILLSTEGAAAVMVYRRMLEEGELAAEAAAVVVNTGAGDVEALAVELGVRRPVVLPRSMPVGGIITPV